MRLPLFLSACAISLPLYAQTPDVVTDIAPVHSLVSRVMDGIGAPQMIIQPNASPHGYAMRPSEARALQNAEVIFWIGDELTPWLEQAVSNLAPNAASIALLDHSETITHSFRTGATFDTGSHEGHDHKEHDDHDHGHHHDDVDPHAWLDPVNAQLWLELIADALSDVDPKNAEVYRANAAAGQGELDGLIADLTAEFQQADILEFVVFHDAYQYFEMRFGLSATGAISLGDATAPGMARIAEIQSTINDQGITCALSEPQFNAALIATAFENTDAKTALIDPIGVNLPIGPQLYPDLLRNMAAAILHCVE
ncbi:zinc ABC transporter substrate-binding protein [Parasulfitobacter algicola]|uniref:High-affinity zinc uptake system protein ZnuA n=1 Tax=Parasulfitobacter algicola TaxID=2614809 RepID=A0ABX2IVW1_9RHOB|nr:zinc ABC transporter substrate-binding protein [Sulfitobacter algicola]NSX54411.1 zinc ABC transporter substrate-binding protein [Sulfitobacter algicola]